MLQFGEPTGLRVATGGPSAAELISTPVAAAAAVAMPASPHARGQAESLSASLQQLQGRGFSQQVRGGRGGGRARVCFARARVIILAAGRAGWEQACSSGAPTTAHGRPLACKHAHASLAMHASTTPRPLRLLRRLLQEQNVIELVTSMLSQEKISAAQAASILQVRPAFCLWGNRRAQRNAGQRNARAAAGRVWVARAAAQAPLCTPIGRWPCLDAPHPL